VNSVSCCEDKELDGSALRTSYERHAGSELGHQIAAVALQIETVNREPVFEGYIESTAYQARQYWRVKGPRDSTLRFTSRVIPVAARTYTDKDIADMENRVRTASADLGATRQTGDPWKTSQAEARLRRVSNLLDKWKGKRPPGAKIDVEVQLLRIGDVAIMAMPGEPFAEIGTELKKASPFRYTMFCGYSSGAGGDYMPVEAEYEYGGYEVERTPYAGPPPENSSRRQQNYLPTCDRNGKIPGSESSSRKCRRPLCLTEDSIIGASFDTILQRDRLYERSSE
jgi:hypothetical protein